MELHHIDVINGNLDEEVYMRQPVKRARRTCLSKSIYGLKQARILPSTSNWFDPCIFTGKPGGEISIIGVYVDDMVLTSEWSRSSWAKKFNIKDLGLLKYCPVDQAKGKVWIDYTRRLKPVSTPVSVGFKQRMARSWWTRPNISLWPDVPVHFHSTWSHILSQQPSQHPTREHWTGVKHLLRYLKGTADLGIRKEWGAQRLLIGVETRRSTSGYVFLRAGGAVSWKSRKQQTVALSTAEALQVL